MSMKARGSGLPSGRGGSGGGKIAVGTSDGTEETIITTSATKLIWQTLGQFGFTAVQSQDEENTIIIGSAPEFLGPIQWSSARTTKVRVSESDISEPDTYLANGFEGQVVDGSLDDFVYNSTLGRGFGEDARLTVKTYHAGTLVDDVTFTCAANGTQTQGNVTIQLSGVADDGDGSAKKGQIRVTVSGDGVIGSTNSGLCEVFLSFKEHKWEELRNHSQTIFRDKDTGTPSIDGGKYIQVPNDSTTHVIKYLSGIGYFDLGSPMIFNIAGFRDYNEDTSKPTDSLVIDSSMFGVTDYASTPYLQPTEFPAYTNLDTQGSFTYSEKPLIDIPDMRTMGTTNYTVTVADSWNVSVPYNSNDLRICIDTFNNPSTDTVEYFDLENMRLDSDYLTSWDSKSYCTDGEAIVFNGGLYHGADLPRVIENVEGVLGTLGSLTNSFPQETITGSARQNPNYTGHTRDAVFFRKFLTPDTSSYASVNMNITTNGDLAAQLASGDLKIYIWKLGSIDPTAPNTTLPSSYTPTNQSASLTNSIWGHAPYNFAAYDDGVAQTAATSGCLFLQTGNILNLTMGGYSLETGILVRFQLKRGVVLKEVGVTFV